jgi:hypothetical protein
VFFVSPAACSDHSSTAFIIYIFWVWVLVVYSAVVGETIVHHFLLINLNNYNYKREYFKYDAPLESQGTVNYTYLLVGTWQSRRAKRLVLLHRLLLSICLLSWQSWGWSFEDWGVFLRLGWVCHEITVHLGHSECLLHKVVAIGCVCLKVVIVCLFSFLTL